MPVEKTPNFIRIRVANPRLFIRFRVKVLGKGIRAVIGFLRGGGSRIQSLLFPRNRFTVSQARAWVKKHGYHVQESYLVTEILIDPETNELVFEESVASNGEEYVPEEKPDTDEWIRTASEDDIKWLMK